MGVGVGVRLAKERPAEVRRGARKNGTSVAKFFSARRIRGPCAPPLQKNPERPAEDRRGARGLSPPARSPRGLRIARRDSVAALGQKRHRRGISPGGSRPEASRSAFCETPGPADGSSLRRSKGIKRVGAAGGISPRRSENGASAADFFLGEAGSEQRARRLFSGRRSVRREFDTATRRRSRSCVPHFLRRARRRRGQGAVNAALRRPDPGRGGGGRGSVGVGVGGGAARRRVSVPKTIAVSRTELRSSSIPPAGLPPGRPDVKFCSSPLTRVSFTRKPPCSTTNPCSRKATPAL